MNWSIDAEWYDASEHLPPVDEEVLCAVKSFGPLWYETTRSFTHKPLVMMCLGSRDPYGWYIYEQYNKQPANVSYWTWLPKVPNVWRAEHEEND